MNEDLLLEVGLTERQYVQQLARLEKSATGAANRIETQFNKANKAPVRMTREFRRATGAMQQFNGGTRNMAMQLSQVAQMGSVTGNWVRALSIQLPDLALGFGTVGIAIGAVAGVLVPLAYDMLTGEQAASDLEDGINALAEAMSRLEAAEKALVGSTGSDFAERYRSLTGPARELLEIEREIAEVRARTTLDRSMRGILSSVGDDLTPDDLVKDLLLLGQINDELAAANEKYFRASAERSDEEASALQRRINDLERQKLQIDTVRSAVDNLAESFGIGEAAALGVVERMAAMVQAGSLEEQARRAVDLAGYLNDVTQSLELSQEEADELFGHLFAAAKAAVDLAAVDMSNISTAADHAARLARNLAAGVAMMSTIRANPDYFDPRGEGRLAGKIQEAPDLGLPSVVLPPNPSRTSSRGRSGGRSGGGGASSADQELNKLLSRRDSLLRELESAQEKYNREVKELEELKPHLSAEKYAQALEALQVELRDTEFAGLISEIESVSDALADAIVNGENLGDALGNVFKQIASDLISSGISTLLTQAFAPVGGTSSGGLFGSFLGLPGRAGGGAVTAGHPYMVGEQGPEPFVPAVNGRVLSVSQAQQAISGGGKTEIIVRAEEGAMFVPRVEAISDGVVVRHGPRMTAQSVAAARRDNANRRWR